MAFAPINKICHALHAYHVPSNDRTQAVEAYHFCAPRGDMKQCVIYDGGESTLLAVALDCYLLLI